MCCSVDSTRSGSRATTRQQSRQSLDPGTTDASDDLMRRSTEPAPAMEAPPLPCPGEAKTSLLQSYTPSGPKRKGPGTAPPRELCPRDTSSRRGTGSRSVSGDPSSEEPWATGLFPFSCVEPSAAGRWCQPGEVADHLGVISSGATCRCPCVVGAARGRRPLADPGRGSVTDPRAPTGSST